MFHQLRLDSWIEDKMPDNGENGEQPTGIDDFISPSTDSNVAEFKANLNACLKSIKSSGTFATFDFDCMGRARDPSIYLKNHATSISLPLSDEDAQKIKLACNAAHTPEGEAVPGNLNSWELTSDHFEIQGDAWKQRLQGIVTTACINLGLYATRDRKFSSKLFDSRSAEISAELSKLVLCEQGDLPEPNQCPEDVPGIFATLSIVLPTNHSGGEVTVSHAGGKKVFDTSRYSNYGASWIACFVDTEYESQPILAGRRLILKYNLVHATAKSTILSEKARDYAHVAQLRSLFSNWKRNFYSEQYPQVLGYVLDHYYTNFCANYSLTGRDHHVGSHLREICEEYGLSLYIAEIELEISGVGCGYDENDELVDWLVSDSGSVGFHTFAEEPDRHASLRKVHDLDGTQIERWLDFDEKYLVQQNVFAGVDPDEEYVDLDEEGDALLTENGMVTLHHIYLRTIALIMPKYHRAEFFVGPYLDSASEAYQIGERATRKPADVPSMIEELSSDLAPHPGNLRILSGLEKICKLVIRRSQELMATNEPYRWSEASTRHTPFFSEALRIQILSTCVDIGCKELFLEAYDLCQDRLPTSSFRYVGVAIRRFQLESMLPKMTAQVIVPYHRLRDQYEILETIWAGLTEEADRLETSLDATYKSWMRDTIYDAVNYDSDYMGTARHGHDLARCCRKLAELSPDDIFNKFLPVVKRQIDHHENTTNTILAFLKSIFDEGFSVALPLDVANRILLDVLPRFASRFTVGYIAYWERQTQQIYNFVTLFDRSYQLGLLSELHIIVSKLTSDYANSKIIEVKEFHTFLLPLLKGLATWLSEKNVPPEGSPIQALFQEALPVYIKRFVLEEPRPPTDWARPRASIYCHCRDHASFNEFLQDPTREVGRFVMSQWRQNHIRAAVDKTEFYTDIDRSERNHALIVIKNHQKHFIADHDKWQKRKDTAAANIKDLASEAELRALLGDLYESVTTASITEDSASGPVVDKSQIDEPPPEAEVESFKSLGKRKATKRKYVESDVEDD